MSVTWQVLLGDVRQTLASLPEASVQCCVTSPPYWGLRDYGTASWDGGDPACDHAESYQHVSTKSTLYSPGESTPGAAAIKHGKQIGKQYADTCGKCGARRVDSQLGLEPTPDAYVANLVQVFMEVRRVLRDDGTCWINLGDSYNAGTTAPSKSSESADVGGWTTRSGDAAGARRIDWPGLKPKDLCGIPWRVAFALQADGWSLRSDIIWSKPNPMPESVTDRPTKAHEYLFLLTKAPRYFYDAEAIKEEGAIPAGTLGAKGSAERFGTPGVNSRPPEYKLYDGTRNKRSVWHIATQPYPEAHFATYPEALIEPCILAGTSEKGQCPACGAPWVRVVERTPSEPARDNYAGKGHMGPHRCGGDRAGGFYPGGPSVTGWQPTCTCAAGDPIPQTVLDPFTGSGTTGAVAVRHQRNFVGCELNPAYLELARRRIGAVAPLLAREGVA